MTTTIQYKVINNYGVPTMYVAPKDSPISKAIQKITGHKTLTDSTKEGLETLGFEFEQVL